jgi:linoleoyl-CoA desaturase
MSEKRQFEYARKITGSDFSQTLALRIDEHFRSSGRSRHADAEMFAKTVLGFALFFATYAWLVWGGLSSWQLVGAYVLHGYVQLFMAFNIAHDANHGAYSANKRVNRLLGCVFDLVGASSYMWRLLHNDAHHAFVNVKEADTTLISGNLFRFTPHDPRKPYHRFQHLYAPFVYCLSTLDWVLTKDFRWLYYERFGNRRIERHPPGELFVLFAGKAFYFTYMLAIPLLLSGAHWGAVLGGFLLMHLLLGFTIALIFQPNHFNEEAAYPEPEPDGQIDNDYVRHIFDTTSDYARSNPLATWLLGSLNLHVIHHMFPAICHVHYPALTPIVKRTAEEFGLDYRENATIAGAFLAHLRWLRALGSTDPAAGPRPSFG